MTANAHPYMEVTHMCRDEYGTCPACGEFIDYCPGHGEIGDPAGRAILDAHDDGDHAQCHPRGCDDATHKRERFASIWPDR